MFGILWKIQKLVNLDSKKSFFLSLRNRFVELTDLEEKIENASVFYQKKQKMKVLMKFAGEVKRILRIKSGLFNLQKILERVQYKKIPFERILEVIKRKQRIHFGSKKLNEIIQIIELRLSNLRLKARSKGILRISFSIHLKEIKLSLEQNSTSSATHFGEEKEKSHLSKILLLVFLSQEFSFFITRLQYKKL